MLIDLTLDIEKGTNRFSTLDNPITLRQQDAEAYVFNVNLRQGGAVLDLTGMTVRFYALRPDGGKVIDGENVAVLSAPDGIVQYTVPRQAHAGGRRHPDLVHPHQLGRLVGINGQHRHQGRPLGGHRGHGRRLHPRSTTSSTRSRRSASPTATPRICARPSGRQSWTRLSTRADGLTPRQTAAWPRSRRSKSATTT